MTGGIEEGEVTGGSYATEVVVIIDKLKVRNESARMEQAAPPDQ